MQNEDKTIDTDTIKPQLKLFPGDKDRTDWLNGLPEQTIFLSRPKSSPMQQAPVWLLTEFHVGPRVVDDMGVCKAVKLFTQVDMSPPIGMWVDPIAFSDTYLMIKILLLGGVDIDNG